MPTIARRTQTDDVAVAANTLLTAVATSFGRISTTMGETSRKLAKSYEKIKATSLAHPKI